MLRVERLIDLQGLEKLIPEWEAIAAELSPRTPFTSPSWNIAWWNHIAVLRRLRMIAANQSVYYQPASTVPRRRLSSGGKNPRRAVMSRLASSSFPP